MKLLRVLIATLAVVVVVPTRSQAQERLGITLAAGAIGGADPAPQADFVTPLYAFSVQGVIKRYFVIEGELGIWSHTLRVEHGPHDVFGPTGVIGRVDGTTIVDAHRTSTLSLHLLVRSTGKVRVFAGGGAGLATDNTEYSQQSVGCSPTLDPRSCERFVNTRLRGPVPVFRALGGVEVPVSTHLSLVASVRADVNAFEDRNRLVAALGGVRFSVK